MKHQPVSPSAGASLRRRLIEYAVLQIFLGVLLAELSGLVLSCLRSVHRAAPFPGLRGSQATFLIEVSAAQRWTAWVILGLFSSYVGIRLRLRAEFVGLLQLLAMLASALAILPLRWMTHLAFR